MTNATSSRTPGFTQGLVLISLVWVSVVAAVVLGPVLPQITARFQNVPGIDWKIPLLATGPALVVALLSIPFGSLADRIGRRQMLLLGLLLYGIAGTAPFWMDSINTIVASRFVVGFAEAAIMTSGTALISDYYHGRLRERWLAAQAGVAPLVALICAVLGGFLGEFGWRTPFLTYALGFILLPCVYFLLWEPARVSAAHLIEEDEEKSTEKKFADEPTHFSWNKAIGIGVCVIFSMVMFMVTIVQFGFVLTERGLSTPATIGLWTGVITIATPLASLIFGLTQARITIKMTISFILFAVGFAVMGLSHTVLIAVIGGFIANLGGGYMMPTAITWLLQNMPAAYRGRGAGLWTTSNFLGQFLSPLVILLLSKLTGSLDGALISCAVACAVAALAFGITTIHGMKGQKT